VIDHVAPGPLDYPGGEYRHVLGRDTSAAYWVENPVVVEVKE
jgi:hypothetical protein